MGSRLGGLLRGLLVVTVVVVFWIVPDLALSPPVNLAVIWAGPFLAYPGVLCGARVLRGQPGPDRVAWTTTGVQAWIGLVLGVPLLRAIWTQADWRGVVLPVPEPVGLGLVLVTGAATLATVVTLALRGLGAPFFARLSGRLATDWLYAWTRNPMALAALSLLVSLGIWFASLLFVVWALVVVTPALLFFIRFYEERELTLRFGDSYREYRARTPMLIPRRPRPPV